MALLPDVVSTAAAEFGVEDPEKLNADILRPVSLSPTTRRQISASERQQLAVDTLSQAARSDQRVQDRLLFEDKMADEAWDREMSQKAKAVEWNDKILIQQQASAMLDGVQDLRPDDPNFADIRANLVAKYPMGVQDPRVNAILAAKGAVFDTAEKLRQEARERQQRLEDARTTRTETNALNQQNQKEDRASRLEDSLTLKVAEMSPEAQAIYDEQRAAGKSPIDAFRAAAPVSRQEISTRDAAEAGRQVSGLTRQISDLQKALGKGEVYGDAKAAVEAEIQDLAAQREIEQEIVNAYRATKKLPKKDGESAASVTGNSAAPATAAPQPAGTPAPVAPDAAIKEVSVSELSKRLGREVSVGESVKVNTRDGRVVVVTATK